MLLLIKEQMNGQDHFFHTQCTLDIDALDFDTKSENSFFNKEKNDKAKAKIFW